MTQFLLDSGDPDEYRKITRLAQEHGEVIFGATTNPTLIAKKLAGKKVTREEAFNLQKQIVMEILEIVPGPVSAEVYADNTTSHLDMAKQGEEIGSWHERIVVKLPTSLEGLKARTILRRKNIPINNTLVFSQEQIFAICLHEQLIQSEPETSSTCFISPFVGRLDDKGEDGMALIEHAMRLKRTYGYSPLILSSSIRKSEHVKRTIDCEADLITAPASAYETWLALSKEERESLDATTYAKNLTPIPYWEPDDSLLSINSIDLLFTQIESGSLNINHHLTDAGVTRFADDWKAIIINP